MSRSGEAPLLRGDGGEGGSAGRTIRSGLAARALSMVIPAGLEPATYRLGICRSILLSYGTSRDGHIAVSGCFANRPEAICCASAAAFPALPDRDRRHGGDRLICCLGRTMRPTERPATGRLRETVSGPTAASSGA